MEINDKARELTTARKEHSKMSEDYQRVVDRADALD